MVSGERCCYRLPVTSYPALNASVPAYAQAAIDLCPDNRKLETGN
jgi:hypothetical protein